MPAQPDPTHPKFLEGDETVPPRMESDDVEGHLAAARPAEDEADPDSGPSQLAAARPADDEADPDSGEGLVAF